MKSKTQFKQLLLLLLVFTFSATLTFGQNCGDINTDGASDIIDALLVAQCYVGLTSCPSAEIGDVNCDGSIDIIDGLLIAQLYVGLVSTLACCDTPTDPPDPTPYITPGADVTLVMQAEDAAWDDADVESDHSGYTGSGYVNTANSSGQWIEWTVDVDRACNAECVFSYATSGSGRPMDLTVNGSGSISLSFPDTGAWTTWSTETADILLDAGSNAIRLTATSSGGAPNMDKMDITISGGEVVTPEPTETPGPTPTPGPTGEWPSDPKELVKTGNPGNAKLISYADNEIGDPTIGTEGTGTARTIYGPIVVPPYVTYDGHGEVLTASGMGDGSQDEGQKPFFILLPWANVKNVTLTAPGCEGIHMMGYNKIENVVWEDVGEDAASVRSYFPGGYIVIDGGSADSAADKVFQVNSPCYVIVKNFTASNISKLLRQNESIAMDIVMDNINASNVKTAIVMANTSSCTLRHRNVSGGSLTNGPVKILPWIDGASDWDGVSTWDGPGSR